MSISAQVGRNDSCPCGSGKKFKKCCLLRNQARIPSPGPAQRNGKQRAVPHTPAQAAPAKEGAATPEPAFLAKLRSWPHVRFVTRDCLGFVKVHEPQQRPFKIVNEEVWICKYELDYLQRLRTWRPGELERMDIAWLNLACAVELPGSEGLVIKDLCKVVDEWAEHIRRETERSYLHFVSYPEEYHHSEPYWRMLMLTAILQQHYGIRYNPEQIQNYSWHDSRDQFIHGLLGPTRTGTCPSIPVLIVAIGRRLGYPLWLCEAPGHVFTRWDERATGFRMNVECHGNGMRVHPDEFYHHWPVEWNEAMFVQERALGPYHRFLRPLEPWETLASFLVLRGHVWESNQRWGEATAVYNTACELVPYNRTYAFYASEAWRKMVDPDYAMFEEVKWKGLTPSYAAYETK
jgi:hypothetical protein